MKRRDIVGRIAALATGGLILPAAAVTAQPPAAIITGPDYDVRKFGAKGDGKTNDAAAIQKAINACSANGGGRVILTNGTFLSGGISFRNHVELHLTSTALLMGTAQLDQYNIDRKFDNNHYVRSFITADGCNHIALTGLGKIDGQGQLFPSNISYAERPYLIQLRSCTDVRMQD